MWGACHETNNGVLFTRRQCESILQVDDGVGAEALPDGRTRLWVHVADPTRWLQPGTPLAAEASRRASSLYLPTGPLSLPHRVFTYIDTTYLMFQALTLFALSQAVLR